MHHEVCYTNEISGESSYRSLTKIPKQYRNKVTMDWKIMYIKSAWSVDAMSQSTQITNTSSHILQTFTYSYQST
jgi:hypothetical protein